MAVLPITVLLLSVHCLGLRADQATCPITIPLEDRLAKMELLLKELKDGQSDILATRCHNHTGPISKGYKDCQAAYDAGHTTSGVHSIKPDGVNLVNAYCDQSTDGGGWTVFQRRMDGSVDFYRGWSDYQKGFGNPSGEYWLGNDLIHALTADHKQKLRVDLQLGSQTAVAKYDKFWIDDKTNNYKLTVSGYAGTAGDSLAYHNGKPFTTHDQDNDGSGLNCAQTYSGAWWYHSCHHSNLNGRYGVNSTKGVNWYSWNHFTSCLSGTRMMIKPS